MINIKLLSNLRFLVLLAGLLQVWPSEAQINLALGKTVDVKSVESAAYPGSNAVDGNGTTKWSSSGNNFAQWLNVDIVDTINVNQVIIRWIDTYFSTTYDIQVSNDKVNWTTIYTITNNVTPRTADTISNLNGLGRYVQFNGRGRGSGNAGARYRIAEFEVYGSLSSPTTPAQQISIDTITQRLYDSYMGYGVDTAVVLGWMRSMLPDGSWASIDYASTASATSWAPNSHLNRLKAMAAAYRVPSSPLYGVDSVKNKTVLGLNYWYIRRPVADNWYFNEIAGPEDYMMPLLLLKGAIADTTKMRLSSYLVDRTVQFAGDGTNLNWVSNITIHKGCIENSYRLVDIGFKAQASLLVIVPTQGDEGIKPDYSFHQHHEQLYTGGYGMSIMGDFANTLGLTAGTVFNQSFSAEKKAILSNTLLQGHRLLGYRSMIDFGSMGRYIARLNAPYTNIDSSTLKKMMAGDTANATPYQQWINHLYYAAPHPAPGNKHFWNSDIMTLRGANYYLSARIISKRTLGAEMINGENIKGYNLPMGATNILSKGDEYHGIYPVWDWSRIPGTTAEMNPDSTALNGYLYGTNSYGGGVSNGSEGLMAYEHNYRGVKAKKAYFFIGDAMLCVGAGITASQTQPIVTSVNQCLSSGSVVFNNGSTGTFSGGSQNFTNLSWVHQDSVGYLFPAGGNITLKNDVQTGSWNSINQSLSSAAVSKNVFSLWFNHTAAPINASYQYIVMPGKSLTDFQNAITNHGFIVVQNDTNIQAVRNSILNLYAIVFYHAGAVNMGDGLTITSPKEALVLIEKDGMYYKISVADPLYNQSSITVTLNKELSGTNAIYANGVTTINAVLPSGGNMGSTVTNTYTNGVVLPVTLLSFTAKVDAGKARLDWATSSEHNSKKFDIFHSADGRTFQKIATINAAGNSTVKQDYFFYHKTPATGLNYYRLQQLDADGKRTDNGIRTIDFGGQNNGDISIYPNPAVRFAIIGLKEGAYRTIELIDQSGKVLKQLPVKNTDANVRLPLTGYPAGNYLLRFTGDRQVVMKKLIVVQ